MIFAGKNGANLQFMSFVQSDTAAKLDRLRQILQEDIEPKMFEHVVAALVAGFLGVGIAVAKSGFQHGADAGAAGRQGRRFRIETKRYSDETTLSDRELLGEIDHAVHRDEALEAWFLAATRDVPEQLENDLMRKGDEMGLPIIIIDWKTVGFPSLGALCTVAPDVVKGFVSEEAAQLSRELSDAAQPSLATLRRDLETWNLGFERLRARSIEQINAIWSNPRTSQSVLLQDAAGGARSTTIKRSHVHNQLDHWWNGRATDDAPAAIIGREGVGKTWAALHWVVETSVQHPIVLAIPSSSVAGFGPATPINLRQFIGERLFELTGTRDPKHWRSRVDRLLQRPIHEGPVLTLIFDGMNQEPDVPWVSILKVLQGSDFASRVRTLVVTRRQHFDEKIRGLCVQPEVIDVNLYDDRPGGELDQRLATENLRRTDLPTELLELARQPRLFELVVRLRESLAGVEHITVHLLLWKYGQDTLGARAFSESEWRDWLAEVARRHIEGIHTYNRRTLGDMVQRADLSTSDVARRLSDIVDGVFVAIGASGEFELSSTLVFHALGLALVSHVSEASSLRREEIERKLVEWLDPIAGLDQRAEILRAAISIFLASHKVESEVVASVFVSEWLRSQNLPDEHRAELRRIAKVLSSALLDVVERSEDMALRSARLIALNALRSIPRADQETQRAIINRCQSWLSVIARGVDAVRTRDSQAEDRRSARLVRRVGADEDGERIVLGLRLTFVEAQRRNGENTIPFLLDGYPLVEALPVLEAAAFSVAISNHTACWDGLEWLCLLNDRDFSETAAAVRVKASEIMARNPEPGVHPQLGIRVAQLLLLLSGDEENEVHASRLNPALDQRLDYERDYLSNPGHSMFALEMRHAPEVLCDSKMPLHWRIRRTASFFSDPYFVPPDKFCAEVLSEMASFDTRTIDASRSRTRQDLLWEEAIPVLARCSPDLLASLVRTKLVGLLDRKPEEAYLAAIGAPDHYLLIDKGFDEVARTLRLALRRSDSKHESAVANRLLLFETSALRPVEKVSRVIEANLDYLSRDFSVVLQQLSSEDVDVLRAKYASGSKQQLRDLLLLLSGVDVQIGDDSWLWLESFIDKPDFPQRGTVFEILCNADAIRLGHSLYRSGWHWGPSEDQTCNHFGSIALATASIGRPFEQYVLAIAPWLLLRAVAIRGESPADGEMAAAVLDRILGLTRVSAPDPGADISVSCEGRAQNPFSINVAARPENADDPLDYFRDSFDPERRSEILNRAVQTAQARITSTWKAGASLYLCSMDPNDFAPIIENFPHVIDAWVEGCEVPTADFVTRVQLAEGFYLALCEAMLARSAERGEHLWRALHSSLTVRWRCAAGINELVHMLFRVQGAPEQLRREQLDIAATNSDLALFDLVLAAVLNGREDWIDRVILEDEASGTVWRRQRAGILRGFRPGNRLPIENAWPTGPSEDPGESRARASTARRRSEALAHHWWRRYWDAETDEESYAAWELFLQDADRRAHLWFRELESDVDDLDAKRQRRVRHLMLNMDRVKSAMRAHEKRLNRVFLGRDIVDGIVPWAGSV